MFIVDVALISKNAPSGCVTFSSKQALLPGLLVVTTIRKKEVTCMVISCKTLAQAKHALRTSTMSIKELPVMRSIQLWQPAIILQLEELALNSGVTLDYALRELLSSTHIPTIGFEADIKSTITTTTTNPYITKNSLCIFSTAIELTNFVAQNPEVKKITPKVANEIISGKKFDQTLCTTFDNCILTTHFDTIIFYRAFSNHYYTYNSPRISRLWMWLHILQKSGKNITLFDYLIPSNVQNLFPSKHIPLILSAPKNPSKSTSEFLRYCIEQTKKYDKSKKILWWYERANVASSLRCGACGAAPTCATCGGTLAITTNEKGKNIALCKNCKHTQPVNDFCLTCSAPIVIHIPGIISIKKMFEDEGFNNVTIITSKDIHTVTDSYEVIFVPLIEQQLKIPSFTQLEKVMSNLLYLNTHGTLKVTQAIYEQLQNLKYVELLALDYEARKQLSLPPFGNFIELSATVTHNQASTIAAFLSQLHTLTPTKILKGLTNSTFLVKSQVSAITPFTAEILYNIRKITNFECSVYPKSDTTDLPFF